MKAFHDHFSDRPGEYAAYRPTYPESLFSWLAGITPKHDRAWDCATGNGQAAESLADFFSEVIATDASESQIVTAQAARPHERVRYLVAPAESVPIPDDVIDLVTIAQAIHWFDLARFYEEVRRVVRPGGMVAAWCYELHTITHEVDAVIHRFYGEILDSYWPAERRIVEEGYRTISFPFEEIAPPSFRMIERWDLAHLLGYLGTWSSVQRFRKQIGTDPRDQILAELQEAWGEPDRPREVVWPLHLRVGRVVKADSTKFHT